MTSKEDDKENDENIQNIEALELEVVPDKNRATENQPEVHEIHQKPEDAVIAQ
jgi:hypothetical protein